MANTGQPVWGRAGAATNAYIVRPDIARTVYYESEASTVVGQVNDFRDVSIPLRGGKYQITGGNGSPIQTIDFKDGYGEKRLTLVEPKSGLPTYGDVAPRVGKYDSFLHASAFTNEVDSAEFPVVGRNSRMNASEAIDDYIALNKDGIRVWREKRVEIDFLCGLLQGMSWGGLSATEPGALGLALPGASAGQTRSCWNTFVVGQTGLTTQSYTRATHEGALSTLLAALGDVADNAFTHDSHVAASHLITEVLRFKPVTLRGKQYKAIALIDPYNVARFWTVGGTASNLFRDAYTRGADNPALNMTGTWVLDGILYIPCSYLAYFRPTADGSTVTYMAETSDPTDSSFTNSSKITQTIYLGAEAIVRGTRPDANILAATERFGKGESYLMQYDDGFTRLEWHSEDGRTTIKNNSSLVMFNYDNGPGLPYAG